MVGKRTSQGCRRCKQKKKGCDQARPRCGQCQRLGTRCEYDQRPFFVVSQGEGSPTKSRSPVPARNSSEDSSSGSDTSIVLGQSLSRTALEAQIDEEFWTSYLPQERILSAMKLRLGVDASSWVPVLRYVSSQSNTARLALDAVAFMTLGRLRQDENLLQQGTRLYSAALRRTNRLLAHPERCRSDAALASTRFLALYEVFRGTTPPSIPSQSMDWQKHVEGTCRILELRGPDASTSDVGHAFFVDARASAILCGIMLKRPVSFSAQMWMTLPWQGRERSVGDELFDIMAVIPRLLQRQDMIYDTVLSSHHALSTMIENGRRVIIDCISAARDLLAWEERIVSISSQEHSISDARSSPYEVFSFGSMSRDSGYGFFDLTSLYWYASVMLFGRTICLHQYLTKAIERSSSLHEHDELPKLPTWLDPEPYAAAIAHHADHFYAAEAGLWGAQHAVFCLGAGTHYYSATGRQASPEMQRLRGAIFTDKGRRFSMAFLRSTAALSTPSLRDSTGKEADAATPEGREILAQRWFRMNEVPSMSFLG